MQNRQAQKTRILCVCDEGNNRSVHLAHPLKYWGNDVLVLGLNNATTTQEMLFAWADIIILTQETQRTSVPTVYEPKVHVFNVGADKYPRPFNPVLQVLVKRYLEENKAWLKHA